ncbi:MAG: LON peptidase substrate-binding domain-containing protein [Acidobacteriales bacterium]|nr:LON peptidase substrate-binding domain-containing protein [Terriglobales bacterium]
MPAQRIPLFPLDLVLFPEMPLPLHIFEPRSKEMISECLRDRKPFGVVRVRPVESRADADQIEDVGCTAEIMDVLHTYPDGRMDVLTLGRQRFAVVSTSEERAFLQGEVESLDDEKEPEAPTDLRKSALELHTEVLLLTAAEVTRPDPESNLLSFQLIAPLPVDLEFKQRFLAMRSERERLETLLEYYTRVLPKLKMLAFGRKKSGATGWVN